MNLGGGGGGRQTCLSFFFLSSSLICLTKKKRETFIFTHILVFQYRKKSNYFRRTNLTFFFVIKKIIYRDSCFTIKRIYNYNIEIEDYTGGCLRFGIRSVQVGGLLSGLTSSLEMIDNGEDLTLLASSRIFVLLLFMDSRSAEKERKSFDWRKKNWIYS